MCLNPGLCREFCLFFKFPSIILVSSSGFLSFYFSATVLLEVFIFTFCGNHSAFSFFHNHLKFFSIFYFTPSIIKERPLEDLFHQLHLFFICDFSIFVTSLKPNLSFFQAILEYFWMLNLSWQGNFSKPLGYFSSLLPFIYFFTFLY